MDAKPRNSCALIGARALKRCTQYTQMKYLPDKIYLVDMNPKMVRAWDEYFGADDRFETIMGDYFETPTDCMASPANSFGFMDGGLDLAIRYELGHEVEVNLQKEIVKKYYGELPVGCALIISTNNKKWPYLISAPTMRVPEDVSHSVNAYLSFRAILWEINKFNEKKDEKVIKSLVCPGLATGIGEMRPENCARQMYMAYEQCLQPPRIQRLDLIHSSQFKMRSKI